MKKLVIIVCLLLFITACGKKDKNIEVNEDNNIDIVNLSKIDNDKDYVYFEEYKEYFLSDGSVYKLQMPVINYNSESASNVSLELKTFINRSIKESIVVNNVLSTGNMIEYKYYESENYFSLIVKYTYIVDGFLGEVKDYVYVFDLKSGKLLDNDDILKLSGRDNLSDLLREKIVSDDIEFTIMTIKNNGYNLYFNNNEELCIIYYEIDNLDNNRKELVL